MSSIFITGGSGYIGKYAVAELAKAGHKLFVLARSKDRLFEGLKGIGWHDFTSIHPVQGDLTSPSLGLSPDDLQRVLTADLIVHAGGPMDIQLKEEAAERVFLGAAREIAELARTLHAAKRLSHFIHVVGYKSPYSDDWENRKPAEPSRREPAYERMKFEADLLIRQELQALQIPLSVINPSVVVGDSVTGVTEQTGGLGLLVDAVRRKLMPLVPGGGSYWLPLVHVDHVAKLIAALAGEAHPANRTYYLLDRQKDSPDMIELIRLIAKETRVGGPKGSVPFPLVKRLLGLGGGRLVGLPKESLDFIVNSDYPTEAKDDIAAASGMPLSLERSTLPLVIADLDYRLAREPVRFPARFQPRTRAGMVTLESPGQGTPIVLVHGTFSHSLPLMPLAQHLSDQGHPVILPDLPGFGRSPFHHDRSVLRGFEQALEGLIRSLNSKVVLVGHSFGGYLAGRMLETMGDRIERAVLLQPVLEPVSPSFRFSPVTQALLRILSLGSLRRRLLSSGSFVSEGEIPEGYLAGLRADMKSPRIRTTTAEVMSALADRRRPRLHPSRWSADKVSVAWGTQDVRSDIPQPFRGLRRTLLPYAHQFPLSHPAETAQYVLQQLLPNTLNTIGEST
ncbi:alpha/beta fold hydrolase [Cohnella boryungensis]|uniref:Alpha/beta fold hydrolase n=1 Tax=Cohnella boryungensis TaxID=768479 RepID=A0ABV8SAK7_9BACL